MSTLPPSIKAKAEFSPVEDVILGLLRPRLEGVQVKTLIEPDQTFPLVLIRRGDSWGGARGHHRFIDNATLIVHTFCEDPDGDEEAALLADAVRVSLRDAWLTQQVVPGRGHLVGFDVQSSPRRVTDWATATGPVQYADLPTGVHRYETRYELLIKRPRSLVLD